MIRFSFGRVHSAGCFDSWVRARTKHPDGAVSDISYDGVKFSYSIKLP
jgi:hypothetical protein